MNPIYVARRRNNIIIKFLCLGAALFGVTWLALILFTPGNPARAQLGSQAPQAAVDALSVKLGLEEPAVRVAVHRLRKTFRSELRAAIAETVSDPAEVDEELRYLERALRL